MAEMITGARARVELPAPERLGGGVLSVARVIDVAGHQLMGVEGETDACAEANVWDHPFCDVDPTWAKTFSGASEVVVGDPIAVYAGVECIRPLADNEARARRRLDYGESRLFDATLIPGVIEDSIVDLGGPYPINQAIGLAEGFAATLYGGVPTLLIPRQIVACACQCGGLRTNLDGSLTTCLGSKVGAYTTADFTLPIPDPLAATMYVTGQITVLRGPVSSVSVPQQINDDGTFAPMRALAERIYVPVFDCLVAKVEVTCS